MGLLAKILFALPVYQSVILTIFLFSSSRRQLSYSRLIMGVFQLFMAFYFTFNLLYSIRAFAILSQIYFFILPVILMFIPVFYLYILSVTTPGFRFKQIYAIHFIPALAIALLNLPYLISTQTEKTEFVSLGNSIQGRQNLFSYLMAIYIIGIYGVFTIQLLYYAFKAVRLYKKHKNYIENRYSYTENINLDWILVLIICFVFFFVSNAILYLVGFSQHLFSQILYNLVMLATMLYVGYRGLLQIDLNGNEQNNYKEILINENQAGGNSNILPIQANVNISVEMINNLTQMSEIKTENSKKYYRSSLTEDQKKVLILRLQNLVEQEKIYINDKLSIDEFASKLDSNSKYISQIINETYNKNFYNFINSYRIEEAKRQLIAEGNEKYSILGIAQSVGFVSKSTFNSAFKQFTGVTPTEFKRKNANELVNN